MKRIITIAMSFVLVLGLGLPTYAQSAKNIDELLGPYQAVIDKVNSDLGSSIYIPDKNKEMVYNNIKSKTTAEFEAMLRNEYKALTVSEPSITQSGSGNYARDTLTVNSQNNEVITPNYVRESIIQTAPISYNSEMFLNSTVFSGTVVAGTYVYESISSYGSQWPSGFTGFHFAVDSGSYSLSSDKKQCTVTLKGHPQDANGVALLIVLTATNTFSAG